MKLLTIKITVLAVILFMLTDVSYDTVFRNTDYLYRVPELKNDGLKIGTSEEAEIDSRYLADAVKAIKKGKYKEIHSILIFKNNKLVLEEYFQGHTYQWDAPGHKGKWVRWNSEMPHALQSVSKSFASICIGIALEQGFIESVEQSIFDFLPDYQQYKDNGKEYITIEHLLTMTSGFAWDEWSSPLSSVQNDAIGIYFSDKNPIEFVLQRPLVAAPGTHFIYSGGDMQLLAEILKNATGMNIDKFSAKYLFEPLGIESFDWWLKYRTGEISTAGGLKLTPRDMIKIGALFLNEGVWDGKRILSGEWVEKSSMPFNNNRGINIPGEDLGKVGYAYTWWTKQNSTSGRMYFALGWGGQKIIVMPEINSIVVFTGANYQSKVKQHKILKKYILPAIS
ncbi:serine hydrolase [Maribellus comscasis]|uniref:Serine hydrolase n=1 Tax=Maribellus comscasis TaxID=2681766 RepID=A0A6I6K263_9BACT|nr:serine hydrolase [Maribellus comscasis]QGY43994.1 serine hydrolase [Maribellus comscasis]